MFELIAYFGQKMPEFNMLFFGRGPNTISIPKLLQNFPKELPESQALPFSSRLDSICRMICRNICHHQKQTQEQDTFATLQGTNISHLGKRKIIFKSAFLGGYVSSQEGIFSVFFWGSTQAIKIHHTSIDTSKMVQQRCVMLVAHSLSQETLFHGSSSFEHPTWN